MSDPISERARKLYGRRLRRRDRRVLLVLLTGAEELSIYSVSIVAKVNSGTTNVILARLENIGWVDAEWEEGAYAGRPRRKFYHLTKFGHVQAMGILGLRYPMTLRAVPDE